MPITPPHQLELADLTDVFGMGIAGNFAGHLEQAGEAADFTRVKADGVGPKGIFPWYVPGSDSFLGQFPLASDSLAWPHNGAIPAGVPIQVQIEPEMALMCTLEWEEDGALTTIVPQWVAAFDDCSLRRPSAHKISDKKNWGVGSKGLAARAFAVNSIDPEGDIATLRLACFLRRDGELHAYGIDSPVANYMLGGQALLDWLIDRLRNQRAGAGTPLEDVGALLHACGARRMLVGVGATRYTPLGETTYLQPGDEAIVVLYCSEAHTPEGVTACVAADELASLVYASVLVRTVR